MNYNNTSPRKLPTNRSFTVIFIRAVCSFAILYLVDSWFMQQDLNTIIKPYTAKKAGFLFWGSKSVKIINEELARRGIDFEVKGLLKAYNFPKITQALNLLCEDYNRKGC